MESPVDFPFKLPEGLPPAYILVEGQVVEEPNFMAAQVWLVTHQQECRIAETHIGKARVSTVFLGTNLCPGMEGPPVTFESMILGGPLDGKMRRYCTLEQARQGHEALVEMAQEAMRAALDNPN